MLLPRICLDSGPWGKLRDYLGGDLSQLEKLLGHGVDESGKIRQTYLKRTYMTSMR